MDNTQQPLEFLNVFPTIIGKSKLPQKYISLISDTTDALFNSHELTDTLDYSDTTTTTGGKQVILYGDNFNQGIELNDPVWQQNKVEVINYIAKLCQQYAWNLLSTQAPWLVKTPAASFQVMPRNMWALNQHAGDYNAIHVHPGTNISGIFYLKVPPGINEKTAPDGCVAFWNNTSLDPLNLEIGGATTMIPKVGDMYLFPSRLPHVVYPFKGDGERRAVSFNYIVMPPGQA